MGTRFILNTTAPSVVPTWPRKNSIFPLANHTQSAAAGNEMSLGTVAATPATTITHNSIALATTPQSHYFGRFTSEPLAAQEFPAQTWNLYMSLGCGNSAANTAHYPTLYLYTPSTNTIKWIFDGTSNPFGRIVFAGGGSIQTEGRISMPAVTAANGDVLVFEFWARGAQTMGTAYPQTADVNNAAAYIECTATTVAFYTGPVGANTPSTADKLDFEPLVAYATTDLAVRSSAALAMTFTPMTAYDATSTVTRAPVLTNSIASPANYTYAPSLNTSATVAKGYTSIPSPAPTYALTTRSASDNIEIRAGPLNFAPMVAYAATSTVKPFLSLPLIGTLKENFEAAPDTIDKWILAGANGAVTFTGGVGVFTVADGITGAKCSIQSKQLFDLRESRVFAKVVQPFRQVGDPGSNSWQLGLTSAGENFIEWAITTDGGIDVQKFTNGAWGWVAELVAAPGYYTSPDTYRWLAISERGGVTYFESAPSTASDPPTEGQWVVRYSAPTNTLPIDASACQFITWIYVNVAGTTAQSLQIDAVNTATVPAVAAAITSDALQATYNLAGADATSTVKQSITSPALKATYTLGASNATSAYVVFVPPLPLISTLTENFEVPPLDTNKWTTSGVSGSVSVSGGVANFAVTNGITGAKCNITSKNFFDLRGTRVFAKVVQPLRQTGDPPNNSYSLGVKSAGENYVAWAFSTAGTLAIHKFTNDAWDGELAAIATGIYATPDTYRWLAVRENAGTIYFESAPNSASNPPTEGQWVVRHSVLSSTLSLDPAACQFIAWIYIGLGATTTAPFQIDGINAATTVGGVVNVPSTADSLNFPAMSAFDATSTITRLVNSTASFAGYTQTPSTQTAATITRRITSDAVPAGYTQTPATSTTAAVVRSWVSIAVAGSWAHDPAPSYGSTGTWANASPGAFSQAASPVAVSFGAAAGFSTYTYSPSATTISLGRVYTSTAVLAGYTFTPSALTRDEVASFETAGYATYTLAPQATTNTIYVAPIARTSTALPVDYTFSAQLTTVSIGRIYASTANAAGYTFTPSTLTRDEVASFETAGYATYALAPQATTNVVYTAPVARTSTALPGDYTLSASSTTVSIGRIIQSTASSTSYSTNAVAAYAALASSVSASPASYNLTGRATYIDRGSVAYNATYNVEAQPTTNALGRIYTSTAASTSYSLNAIESFASFALVSSAFQGTYSLTGVAATSGSLRSVVSNALEAAYTYAGYGTTDSIVLASSGAAQPAGYISFARESFGTVERASTALQFSFVGVAGSVTTARATRVAVPFPAEYIMLASPTNIVGGLPTVRHTSEALPALFKHSGGSHWDYVNINSVALSTTYAASPLATTAQPTKESKATPAGYGSYIPDTVSFAGRVTFSTALQAGYTFSPQATVSYVPVKLTSNALPPTAYLVNARATTINRGHVSPAEAVRYLQEYVPWPVTSIASNQVKPPIVFPSYTPRAVITDAQFSTWLENERALRVVLIETQCIEPITGNTEFIYFASSGFVTKHEDGAPVFYAPLMRGGLEFAQTIDLDLSGSYSYGDIELDNATGELDWMFDRVWLFKEFKAYVGDASWPRRDFRQIFDGTIEDVDSSQRDTVNVRIRDKLYRLDMPLHDLKMGGVGANADRLQPVTFGECHNITPVLKDATQLIYEYHARVGETVIEVRDNGIPVLCDILTGAPASFKLKKQPYGRITCSVQGDRIPSLDGYANTVSTIVRRLITEWGTETDNRFKSTDIDIDNFTVFHLTNKAPVGLYQTERMTVLAACQEVAASIGARLTMTALGKARLVKLQLPPPPPSSSNLQYNGDFDSGTNGWYYSGTNNAGTVPDPYYPVATSLNLGGADAWNIPGQFTFFSHQIGGKVNPNYYYEYGGPAILVEPGKRYTVSAYVGAHRCKVQVVFWEYDFFGNLLGSSPMAASSYCTAYQPGGVGIGGSTIEGYKYVYDSAITRTNTHSIRVMLRKFDTDALPAENVDSWMFVTRVRVESEGSAVAAPIVVTESDMVSGSLHIADRLPIVPGVRLGYCKNWTVQEDTAAGIPEDHKSMYAREWLTVLNVDPALRDKYGLSSEPEQENCLLLDKASASDECGRRISLRSAQRHVYEFVGFANLMFTPVGAAMTLKHRRFGLSAGKTGQVISVAVNWLTSQVTLKVLI